MLNSEKQEIQTIPCGKALGFLLSSQFQKNKKINGIQNTFGVSVLNSKGINVTWLNHKLTDQEIDLNKTEKLLLK